MSFSFLRPHAGPLRLLVMAVAERCDQRCLHCDIWRADDTRPGLTLEERLAVVEEALRVGVEEALLTGGEPLLSPDLWPVARRLDEAGARLMLATNGMRLQRFADQVGERFDEVYVSLDGGEPTTHDRVRGSSSFARLRSGLEAVRRRSPRPRLVARSVLHAGNVDEIEATMAAAESLGFDHLSFLALDASSAAFGGRPERRHELVPTDAQVARLRDAIDRREARGTLGSGFVLESAEKLRRIADHLDASGGRRDFVRPDCDAPLWSSVVEADGRVRPCFFHEPVGDARAGLVRLRESAPYRSALDRIRAPNTTCERCVCPKRRAAGFKSALGGLRRRLIA